MLASFEDTGSNLWFMHLLPQSASLKVLWDVFIVLGIRRDVGANELLHCIGH